MLEDVIYKRRNKPTRLSDSEIIVILFLFHFSYKCRPQDLTENNKKKEILMQNPFQRSYIS